MARTLPFESTLLTPVPSASAQRVPTAGSRTLAGMLLAAVLAALLVVADQLIDTWVDGHLLLMWVALWTVTFTMLAFLATPLRKLTGAIAQGLARWSRYQAQQREEAVFWAVAEQVPRVLRELRMARWHAES